MDQRDRNYVTTNQQFHYFGRSSNSENTSLAQPRENHLRADIHSHYQSNLGRWSNIHHASNFSSEMPSLGQTSAGSTHCLRPFTFLTGNYSNYTPSVAHHQFVGYDRSSHGVSTATSAGRFPLKRKSPDVSAVFDRGSSSWAPFEASSSTSALLDRQFDDNQNTSQHSTGFQQYSRSNHLNIPNNSGRNVRCRSGPYTSQHIHATFDPVNHSVAAHNPHVNASASAAWNFNFVPSHGHGRTVSDYLAPAPITSQHFHATFVPANHSVAAHNPHINASASAAWNFNSASSHGLPRTVSETNGVSSEANQFLVGSHGLEAGQFSYNTTTGRNALPPSRYLESYGNNIPTGTWCSTSLSYREDNRRVGDEYQATSGRRLQLTTETYSSRYSWSSSTRICYQNDRATGAIERYPSQATIDRNDRAPSNGFHAEYAYETPYSDHHLQCPTEAFSSRYSRPYSTGMGHTSYQSDWARSTNEHFLSLPAAMNRNGSMATQHHVMEDDMFSYNPRPRDTDAYDQYEDMRLDIDNMSYEELLALGEQIGNVKTGLSEDKMSNCLVESWNCASDENEEERFCPICLDELSNMDKVMKLRRCGHEYHAQCITKWLDMKNVCPLCKRSAASDS